MFPLEKLDCGLKRQLWEEWISKVILFIVFNNSEAIV